MMFDISHQDENDVPVDIKVKFCHQSIGESVVNPISIVKE